MGDNNFCGDPNISQIPKIPPKSEIYLLVGARFLGEGPFTKHGIPGSIWNGIGIEAMKVDSFTQLMGRAHVVVAMVFFIRFDL